MIAALAVMAAVMLIFVRILANVAVEYDIRKSLDKEAYKNLKEIAADDAGNIVYKDNFVQQEGDIHFLILEEDGAIIFGQYPKGCPQGIEVNAKRLQHVTKGWEQFYIRDMRKRIRNERAVYLRAIIRKADAYSRYQTLEYLAYVSILAVFGVAIFGGILLARRISSSLKEMCRSAEAIGQK